MRLRSLPMSLTAGKASPHRDFQHAEHAAFGGLRRSSAFAILGPMPALRQPASAWTETLRSSAFDHCDQLHAGTNANKTAFMNRNPRSVSRARVPSRCR